MTTSRSALVFSIAGWTGFYIMAVELLSGRILAPYFGNSIYVWGGVITVFMLALSVGYLAGGHLSSHNASLRRLGLLSILAGLATTPALLCHEAALDWISVVVPDPRYGSLLGSTLLFFIPTVIAGTISPYAIQLLVKQHQSSGRHAGQLYFVSTFGSAAGTILTSFYLVLWFEINQILILLVATSVVLGTITLPLREHP